MKANSPVLADMESKKASPIKKFAYIAGFVTVSLLFALVAGLYIYLIVLSPSSTVILAFISFIFLALCTTMWRFCPKFKNPPQKQKSSFVLTMPIYFKRKPTILYRIFRLMLIASIVLFCIMNCLLCIYDENQPYISSIFVIAGVGAITIYIYVINQENSL